MDLARRPRVTVVGLALVEPEPQHYVEAEVRGQVAVHRVRLT
jgi:hypothetical protein